MLGLLCSFFAASAQSPTDTLPGDPGGITVTKTQNLAFGAFTCGATGGNITISNADVRSSTGTIMPINSLPYFAAIYEIDAPVGSIISIMNGSSVNLTGSNGGSMLLTLGSASTGSYFVTTVQQPIRTIVKIGGTLAVGSAAANPPGNYTGSFFVTFTQE